MIRMLIVPKLLAVLVIGFTIAVAQAPESTSKAQDAAQGKDAAVEPAAPNPDFAPPVTGEPQTRILDKAAAKGEGVTGAHDPLLETGPLPEGNPTLVGGIAVNVDRVRSRVTVEPFGSGKRMQIYLDERTRLYRDGAETTIMGIRKGDRVYADTTLDGPRVFARNLRVLSKSTQSEVRGQVTDYNAAEGILTVHDPLADRPVAFRVSKQTSISGARGNAQLAPGALVDIVFGQERDHRSARQINILAAPGQSFVFSGTLTYVNLRDGLLSIENRTDSKTYDLHFEPGRSDANLLHVGAAVTISATFNGDVYQAHTISEMAASAAVPQ